MLSCISGAADVKQPLNTNSLLERIQQDSNGNWTTQCHDLTLRSAFQPIISLNHRRVVGHEALIRAYDPQQNPVNPLELFGRPTAIQETIELDRLCRLLHSFNYSRSDIRNEWLFLNVNPEVVNHGREYGSFFSQMIQDATISPSQIVIEILENRATNEVELTDSISYYRQLGCLLAIDDFGAGHSNIDRVLNLEPEIVKLDKSLLKKSNPKARRILSNLVSLLHEAGCLVVLEGIETLDETLLAYDVDADLVQGYFFSRPQMELTRNLPNDLFPKLDEARERHQHTISTFKRGVLSPYHYIFEQAVADYEKGDGFTRATQFLLQVEGVQRIYLLDGHGNLIGNNLFPTHMSGKLRPQMAPMQDSSGANLGNRHYFRRAMANPASTQTTRPYLSTVGAELCVTLSRRVERKGEAGVICCDLALSENL